jgi:hypothetical protein
MKRNLFLASCCIAIAMWGCTDPKDETTPENDDKTGETVVASKIPNDEIWYTTIDGKTISSNSDFGAPLISNTYTDGKGILKFSKNITKIRS